MAKIDNSIPAFFAFYGKIDLRREDNFARLCRNDPYLSGWIMEVWHRMGLNPHPGKHAAMEKIQQYYQGYLDGDGIIPQYKGLETKGYKSPSAGPEPDETPELRALRIHSYTINVGDKCPKRNSGNTKKGSRRKCQATITSPSSATP